MARNAERRRLDDAGERGIPWKKWGPYLSERQWGTVFRAAGRERGRPGAGRATVTGDSAMRRSRTQVGWRRLGAMLAIAVFAAMVPAAESVAAKEEAPEVSFDGLRKVPSENVGLLYVREGATLATYRKVWLGPVQVEFHKNWKPEQQLRGVGRIDRDRIRRDLAEECAKVFTEELKDGGYEVVHAAGPDVLRVNTAIVNLYINAPDTMSSGRSRTYTFSTGEMTLVVELRDSSTGEIIARAADRKSDRASTWLQHTTSVHNAAAARQAISEWASALREAMDSARSAESAAPRG